MSTQETALGINLRKNNIASANGKYFIRGVCPEDPQPARQVSIPEYGGR
jgi:hypothetical protein